MSSLSRHEINNKTPPNVHNDVAFSNRDGTEKGKEGDKNEKESEGVSETKTERHT